MCSAAANNAAVAASLKLLRDDDGKFGAELVFGSEVIGNEGQDKQHVMAHPLHGVAFLGDSVNAGLLVRVPGFGARSRIGLPEFHVNADVNCPRRIVIPVERANTEDIAQQLMPDCSQELIDQKRVDLAALVADAFGRHTDYATVNAAFVSMTPPLETWTIEVWVKEPYHFKDLSTVVMLQSTTSDCLMMLPLEKEAPVAAVKKVRVIKMGPPEENN